MLFIPCHNWKTLILNKFIFTQRFYATIMLLCSLKQVFWIKFVFYVCYFHNNILMLLINFNKFYFWKFRCSINWIFWVTETYHQCELCLEKKKIFHLEIKNLLLSIMLFSDSIYFNNVNNGNTRIMCEICSKLIISDVRWR